MRQPLRQPTITDQVRRDVGVLWEFHLMGHELVRCDVAVGLGSHDLGVATTAARLYAAGWFPLLVFTGDTSPTTAATFPRGEAVHYREHALTLGVPDDAILVEPRATNTGENIAFTRALLAERGRRPRRVLLITKPYMQRRAYATTRKTWPEVDVVCASAPLDFASYAHTIGDERLVIDMVVGDLHRVIAYPSRGFAIEQDVPEPVRAAFDRLVAAGFDSRVAA